MPAFSLCAWLGFADFLIEDDDGVFWIESLVALLRVGMVKFVQCLNNRVRHTEQTFSFQGIAHARIDAMHFAPGLGNNNRRCVLLREPEIFVGELIGLIAQAARHHCAHLIELLKRFSEPAVCSRVHCVSILLDAFAFLVIASKRRVLSANLVQLHRFDAGMSLNGE